MSGKHYGYIAVNVGSEIKTAAVIKNRYPEIDAYAISQVKHKSTNGIKSHTSSIMVPGYIVFCTNEYFPFMELKMIQSVNKILTYDDNSWSLKGNDLFCAKWIVEHNGVVGVSTIFMEGDEIKIIDGPLLSILGKIVRIDKRNRNALVELHFVRQTKVWLAFEWLEPVKV